MNPVQELIDEHMDQLPVSLAKKLLDACKAEAEAKPSLYRITFTKITYSARVMHEDEATEYADVQLQHYTQTMIVEAILRWSGRRPVDLLAEGKIEERWLEQPLPLVWGDEDDSYKLVVSSIEPYDAANKRARAD